MLIRMRNTNSTTQMKCYAIIETPNGDRIARIPLLYRKRTPVFPSLEKAVQSLNAWSSKLAANSRGLVYEVQQDGSAFDHQPVYSIAL